MQTEDASAEIIFKLWPWLEANKNRLIGVGVAAILIWGVVYFISSQKEQKETEAGQALTSLMINPPANVNLADSFAGIAAKYSGTAAGQRAGKYPDAQAQFQKYLEAGSSLPLAATAQLGVAACLEAQNKLDQAVTAYQRVTSVYSGSASVMQAEFALGRIAEQQNKLSEAATHFENAARNVGGGALAQEAGMRAQQVRAKLAMAAPKPAASSAPAISSTVTNKAP
jgi:tetratricopeptide (TPR) repeat protein